MLLRNPDEITLEWKGNNKLNWEELTVLQHQVLISTYSVFQTISIKFCEFSSYKSCTFPVMFILGYFMVSCWEWVLHPPHGYISRLVI